MAVHPLAHVAPGARLDPTAEVGPFCVVGPHVVIGPRTRLLAHVVVEGHTTLGADNVLHPFASLGGLPQDRKYDGEPAHLVVGDRNVFRESVTVNIGTRGGEMATRIGDDCLLMAGSHVAHDCTLGNGVTMANGVALAGHVALHDGAILGGLAAVHQFCRVGRLAFVGGGGMVAQDVPPFCVAQGDRASIAGLNVVGLRRAGMARAEMHALRAACALLFGGAVPRADALMRLDAVAASSPAVAEVVAFVRSARRGICGARRPAQGGMVDGALDAAEGDGFGSLREHLELVADAR